MSEEKKMDLWSGLTDDLLRTIAGEKICLEDFIRFQSVCKHWNSSIDTSSCLPRPQLPWLVLPYCHHPNHTATSTSSTSCRCFYSISDGKTHHIQFPTGYDDKRCFGSSHGWLIMLEETSPSIFLINPLTNQRIELPPQYSFPDVLAFKAKRRGREYRVQFNSFQGHASFLEFAQYHITKIVLSSDPTLPNCTALAIFGGMRRLAYCRLGQDRNWTEVHHDITYREEILFWKGSFYAAGNGGSLCVFHPNTSFNSPPKVDVIIEHDPREEVSINGGAGRCYLVADSILDELWLVCKEVDFEGDEDDEDLPCKTSYIHAHSLNQEKKVWEKKQSLGGKVLFLGYNHTLCFSAAHYTELKPNTIYFTDDYFEGYTKGKVGGNDVGIFDMDDGVFKPLPCCDPHALFLWPPPVWVTPSLAATFTSST